MRKSLNLESWYKFFYEIIAYLGSIVLIIINTLAMTTRLWVNWSEHHRNIINGPIFRLLLFIAVLLVILLARPLSKIKPKYLFMLGTIIWLGIGCYYLLTMPAVWDFWQYDQSNTFNAAIEINHGNYSPLVDRYLSLYPFQIGLVTYDRLIVALSDNVLFAYFVNLAEVIAINYLQWRLVKLFILDNQIVENYTILFSFSFLPLLYFTGFIYGNIPGFLAMFIAVYFGLRYLKDKDKYKYSWIVMIIFFIIADLIKNNYLVPAIAMAIIYLLNFLRNKKICYPVIALALILGIGISNKAIISYYEHVSGERMAQGIPKIAWVVMGQHYRKDTDTYGYYDFYTENGYAKYKGNTEAFEEKAKEDLKERLDYFKEHPQKMFSFYGHKIIQTWTDPMFMSIKSTSHANDISNPVSGNPTTKEAKKTLYYQETVGMNILNVVIMLFALFEIFMTRFKRSNYQIFIILFLLGGFIFHLFWEIKSQYVFQFIYCLIPLTAAALTKIGEKAYQLIKR